MRQHRHSATEPPLGGSADCLAEAFIQEIAAGIAPPGVMEKHGEHIANCDRCALLLKRYLFEFSDEMTPEEEAILSGLESSKPEWQEKLVQKMLGQMNQKPGRPD